MQFLGKFDSADGPERILGSEQQHAALSGSVVDKGEPLQIAIEGGDEPLEEAAWRRPVVMAIRAVIAPNGEAGERHGILCRFEEQRLDRAIEHMGMQLEQILNNRKSCRAFLDHPIDQQLLHSIIAKAARAPSNGNLQPWQIYIVKGAALASLKQTTKQ